MLQPDQPPLGLLIGGLRASEMRADLLEISEALAEVGFELTQAFEAQIAEMNKAFSAALAQAEQQGQILLERDGELQPAPFDTDEPA